MNFPTLPAHEKFIFSTLLSHGFQAFLVGGAVRDFFRGIDPTDFDIATDASPSQIKDLFSTFMRVDFVGESFGVCLVGGVEVATFRNDIHLGGNHRDTEVTFVKTIEEDLSRRDFTINAIAMDIDGNVVDPFGGISDLANKIVRFVGNPLERIKEDNNRVFRACRFVAVLDGKLERETATAIMNIHCWPRLSFNVAPERIQLEILKTLKTTRKASVFFETLWEVGLLSKVFPELIYGRDHDHGDYHSEDVWQHNMIVGDSITTKYPLVKLAGYLHDIGKPSSYNGLDKSFHDHEKIGERIVRERLFDLRFSTESINNVAHLVRYHMRSLRGLTPKAKRRTLVLLHEKNVWWRDLIRLRVGDTCGNLAKPNPDINTIREYITTFKNNEFVPVNVLNLDIDGREIMNILGIEPGPRVGAAQKLLLQYVIDNGEEFNTFEHLSGVLKILEV
jgi:putative nucleotidyltransferase with HDIG domain